MGKGGYYNNYKAFEKTREGAFGKGYISYVAPHLYSAFCLVLYDKYGWDEDQISECILAADELWDRAGREGWDIKENCYECTGIDVSHFRDKGEIIIDDKYRPMTMAQRAERMRRERMQNDL